MGKRNTSGMLVGLHFLALVWSGVGWTQAAEAPVKLAILAEGGEFASVADLLTVELSAQPQLQVLERSQIERIYREQQISAANRDYVKLGQLLGADGLLMLDSAENENDSSAIKPPSFAATTSQKTQALNVRLLAVKPGVVLAAERFMVASDKMSEWTDAYVRRIQPLLPKLAVLAKDAVPISVVNLRSAVSSSETPELERQLKTLVVQRLSREPQLFVLERQRLQQASEEKNLMADETRFWNGAWLLEGVVDQNSYFKSVITLNVKLTPAKGGALLQIEVSGSRTNLAAVINALAERVVASLRITSTVKEWNAADEAARFFAEAKWAMNWKVFRQAQTAADAAWALGKHDLDCALIRGKSYLAGVTANLTPYELTKTTFSPGVDANGLVVSAPPSEAHIQASINATLAEYPWGGFYKRGKKSRNGSITVEYALVTGLPSPQNIERAKRILELYLEFSRTSPEGQPQVLTRGKGWNDWHNSDWYQLGIEKLVAASKVLQNFYFAPKMDASVATELAELRSLVRMVAATISESPTVRDSFFVGGRIANHDELAHTMEERPSIFSCMTEWGCFWQERPEETLELYRKLMESPVFCYIHTVFWNRSLLQPRLVAWNQNDRQRLPNLWDDFMRELNGSTNPLLQMEAKGLARADATDDELIKKAEEEWWSVVRSNRPALVANNVELFYLGWKFISNAETEAMNREYWNKTIPAVRAGSAFESQKTFLRENQSYEFTKFVDIFREKSYSQKQALELLPLIVAYKSNLLAKAQLVERPQKFRLESDARNVEFFLQRHVEKIAHPDAQPAPPKSVQPAIAAAPKPARPAKRLEAQEEISDTVTNIILVKKFLEIPLKGLSEETLSSIGIKSHHLFSGKLLLDLQLGRVIYSSGDNGKWKSTSYVNIPAIAVLDIASERWQVIEYEETGTIQLNPFYHHSAFWRGSVFTSQGGKVRRYDETRKAWVDLEIPDVGNCGLFVVNERLYGVTRNLIFEILEGGAGMLILASNRRQPPASALDSEELSISGYALGTPALFGDSKGTLRVVTAKRIFSHDGADWRPACDLPLSPGIPQITDESILFGDGNWHTSASIWRLPVSADGVEYCLGKNQSAARQKPLWELPAGLPMSQLPAVSRGSDLLVLMDHSKTQNIVDEKNHVITSILILPQDGYHAALLNFSTNSATPQKLHLKFDDDGAVLPVSGNPTAGGSMPNTGPETWLCRANGNLYLGRESFGMPSAGGRLGELPRTGVWVISLEQLDREIGLQKKIQDKWQAQKAAETGQAAQMLLEKFDLNRDGRIDGGEKETALADENFLAAHMHQVDTNRNGFVDAGELKYFDANADSVLDTNEQSGIKHAQRLLAARWLRQADSSGDGLLDRREFDDLMRSALDPSVRPMMVSWFPDDNHDNFIDVEEVQAFCKQQTVHGLQNRSMPGRPFTPQRMPGSGKVMEADQRFKTLVDDFWKNGGSNSVSQPRRPGFMPPTIPIPIQPK